MKTYLVVTFGAMLLAAGGTVLAIRLAHLLRLFDRPGVRKVHAVAIPRIGGVALVLATLLIVAPVLVLDNVIGASFRAVREELAALFIGSLLIFALGLVDDVRGLRARTKLAGQLLVAGGVCAFGVRISEIALPGGMLLDLGWLGCPLTVLWIVGITNALNLIDGLDGLAAGIAAIACGVIATLAVLTGQPVMAVLMLALLGSLCGFLFFNFNPARIFMGDCGSLFVGFVLGSASVLCTTKTAALFGLAIPLLALGVPVFDMLFCMMRRFLERRSPFAPDRGHIHHRLLELGLSQRRAVIMLYGVTFLVASLSLCMMASREALGIAVFACLALFLVAIFRLVGAVRLRESLGRLRETLGVALAAKDERRCFEEAQLRLREADSFEAWWGGLCEAARQLELRSLSLALRHAGDATRVLIWRLPAANGSGTNLLQLRFQVQQENSSRLALIEARVAVNGSLEAAGRRAALFGRLIDEFGRAGLTFGQTAAAWRRSG